MTADVEVNLSLDNDGKGRAPQSRSTCVKALNVKAQVRCSRRARLRGTVYTRKQAQSMAYDLIMHLGEDEMYSVTAVCGPRDDGEPTITLMSVGED